MFGLTKNEVDEVNRRLNLDAGASPSSLHLLEKIGFALIAVLIVGAFFDLLTFVKIVGFVVGLCSFATICLVLYGIIFDGKTQ